MGKASCLHYFQSNLLLAFLGLSTLYLPTLYPARQPGLTIVRKFCNGIQSRKGFKSCKAFQRDLLQCTKLFKSLNFFGAFIYIINSLKDQNVVCNNEQEKQRRHKCLITQEQQNKRQLTQKCCQTEQNHLKNSIRLGIHTTTKLLLKNCQQRN